MRAQFLAEANQAPDIFDTQSSPVINQMLAKQQDARHQELVQQMRQAIKSTEDAAGEDSYYSSYTTAQAINPAAMAPQPTRTRSAYQPITPVQQQAPVNPSVQAQLQNLANNPDYSVATISKEANRIEQQNI